MNEAALALDPSGRVLYCNAYFGTLVGVERAAVEGRFLVDFVAAEHRSFFAGLADVTHDASRRAELELLGAQGERLPVYATLNALHTEGGAVLGLVLTDLREQKRREALVIESERKDQFLAMLAHELRNPLAPVKHATEILRNKTGTDPGVVWATDVIDRQVSQLSRLVDDLLDVARITRGKIQLSREPVELAVVIAGAVESSQPLIQVRGHRLQVALPTEPIWLMADTTRLTQVFANLLNNAAKFTPERGEIFVTARVVEKTVEVSVRDTGIGISGPMLQRVFELFAQAESSPARAQGGLGIGLTLARDLVEMHGGTVEAKSGGEGKGTEMLVRLPVADGITQPSRSAPRPGGAPQRGRRVIVIDDNIDAGKTLADLLELWGHEVITLSRGADAVETARSFKPDIMFIDIGLPDLDGYQVARNLRQVPELSRVVLIALTGYGQEEDRLQALAAGFDQHRVKPLDVGPLESLLGAVAAPKPP
jgi:signal transduction histidine kinase